MAAGIVPVKSLAIGAIVEVKQNPKPSKKYAKPIEETEYDKHMALDATTLASTSVDNVAGLENSETSFTLLGSFLTTESIQFAFGDVGTTSVIVYEPLAAAPGASSPRYTHTGGYLASAPIVVNVGELVQVSLVYSGGAIVQSVSA